MQKEWTEGLSWNVKPEDLEMLSEDFLLERTNREIHDSDATQVASRISDALKKLSIMAEYDGQKAKAKCQTQDFVSFRIRLYAGGMSGQPIIVEVQRRSGGARSFMQSCRAILSAAEGKMLESKLMAPPTSPPAAIMRPISQMKCLQAVLQETDDSVVLSALEKVVDMLNKSQRDTQILALENLCCLTDPIKTTPKGATLAAKSVVLRSEKICLRDEIVVVFTQCTEQEDEESERGEKLHDKARHLCLRAFSNSLTLLAQAGSLKESVANDGEAWFVDRLLPQLLDEMKDAATAPNNAYLAACCVTCLLCARTAVDTMDRMEGIKTMRDAHHVGCQIHELLERETGRCLDKLESLL